MGRPRLVQAKAELSGKVAHDPKRFAGRTSPKKPRALGIPYVRMTEEQRAYWEELKRDMPWLTVSDRPMVRMACMWLVKMDEEPEDFGIGPTKALVAVLSKLGATPTDINRVNHADDEDEENPEARFFGT